MMNKIFLMGRLVADPELKSTPSGTMVCTSRIACDRDIKDKTTGERKTDFINLVSWRSAAEFVARYFRKGSMIAVVGRLQIRDYVDKDGNKRYATEVVTENIYFADSKQLGGMEGVAGELDEMARQAASAGKYTPPSEAGQFSELAPEDDGDLPF